MADGYPGEGNRRLMPDRWREIIVVMIAAMAQRPETDPDVISAADRCSDHIATEVMTIRYINRK